MHTYTYTQVLHECWRTFRAGLKLDDPLNVSNRFGSWKALEKLYDEGRARAIGVSNYTIAHMQQLLAWPDLRIRPHGTASQATTEICNITLC